jgi:lipoprotein-anchoring transpeptidase ErfK/SrfK
MRRILGAAVLVLAMAVGARVAAAQVVDPTTGIMVDASTDPMDFSAIMSGQPTNVGLEAGLSAAAQAQADMNATMAASQSMTDSLNASNASDDTPAVPALPRTPNPTITPGGGTFKGSVQVTIADSDGAAAVFYTTDGTKPTTSSQRYVGPILVSAASKAAKTKVQALAFDVNMQPSGVVSKTFKVKGS